MFNTNTAKTLIVVFKDEMLANQIKKLVETSDDIDADKVVGTRDNSVKIVAWNEKTWLANKKAGNIDSKILFLGNIKGVDKLIPVIDIKFDKYGVKYGWAGKQAVVFTDEKELTDAETYNEFLNEIAEYPIPDVIKNAITPISNEKQDRTVKKFKKINKIKNERLSNLVNKGFEVAEKASVGVAQNIHIAQRTYETLKDKSMIRKQMLFYGVLNLYNNDLEEFMNS